MSPHQVQSHLVRELGERARCLGGECRERGELGILETAALVEERSARDREGVAVECGHERGAGSDLEG